MTEQKPRATICMPVYNGESLLPTAINSILSQSFRDFVLIIVDNASTDRTQEICLEYANKDPRVKYYRNPENIGLTRNYNRAFEFVETEYFTFMAHDDYWGPGFLAKCIEKLDSDPSIVLCHSKIMLVDKENGFVGPYADSLQFPDEQSPYPHKRFKNLVMINHYCLDDYGLMRKNAITFSPLYESHFGSDRNFLAEVSLIGKFYHIPEILFYWRDEQEKYSKYNSWTYRLVVWREWCMRLDSSKPDKIPVPHWSLLFGYLRSIRRVRLDARERIQSYLVVSEWILRNAKRLVKDLVIASAIFFLVVYGYLSRMFGFLRKRHSAKV